MENILSSTQMQTIAAVSLAGGQGKTTTCYFLAKMLAQAGKKVLAGLWEKSDRERLHSK